MPSLCATVAGKRRRVGYTLLAGCFSLLPHTNTAFVPTGAPMCGESTQGRELGRLRATGEGVFGSFVVPRVGRVRLGSSKVLGRGASQFELSMVFDLLDPGGRSKVSCHDQPLTDSGLKSNRTDSKNQRSGPARLRL